MLPICRNSCSAARRCATAAGPSLTISRLRAASRCKCAARCRLPSASAFSASWAKSRAASAGCPTAKRRCASISRGSRAAPSALRGPKSGGPSRIRPRRRGRPVRKRMASSPELSVEIASVQVRIFSLVLGLQHPDRGRGRGTDDRAAEDEETGMRHHPVGGPQPLRHGLGVTQEHLAYCDEFESLAAHRDEQLGDLIGGGHEAAEETAALQGAVSLAGEVPRVWHVQKERVNVRLVEAGGDIAQLEGDAVGKADALEVLAGEVLHVLAHLVADHAPGWSYSLRQHGRQPAAAGPGLEHGDAGTHGKLHQNETNVLWVKDLRVALDLADQIVGGGLQQEEGVALVGEDFGAEGPADEGVVLKDAAMRVQLLAGGEPEDEMFVVALDQLNDVACLGRYHETNVPREDPIRGRLYFIPG